MTFGPGVPDWAVGLAAIAGDLQDSIARTAFVAGVHVRPSIPTPDDVVVAVTSHSAGRDETSWLIAFHVRPLWLRMLADYPVGLVVKAPGWSCRAPHELMVRFAGGGMGRAEWLLATTRVVDDK